MTFFKKTFAVLFIFIGSLYYLRIVLGIDFLSIPPKKSVVAEMKDIFSDGIPKDKSPPNKISAEAPEMRDTNSPTSLRRPNSNPSPKASPTPPLREIPPARPSQTQNQGPPNHVSPTGVLTAREAERRAKDGDAHAQAVMSIYYSLGYKTAKDIAKAAEYALLSSKQKNPLGIYRLAAMMENGDGFEKNEAEAKKLKKLSLNGLNSMQGDPYALTALGVMLFRGEGGLRQDRELAVELYKRAADMGYAPAQFNYSVALAYGQGTRKNNSESSKYWRMAYEQNYPPALKGSPVESTNDEESTDNTNFSPVRLTFQEKRDSQLSSHIKLDSNNSGSSYKIPLGISSGKRGFVKSPYAPGADLVDVRGVPSGTQVKCPFTKNTFLVP